MATRAGFPGDATFERGRLYRAAQGRFGFTALERPTARDKARVATSGGLWDPLKGVRGETGPRAATAETSKKQPNKLEPSTKPERMIPKGKGEEIPDCFL